MQPQSLDAQNRVVLEAVLARLGEFASSLGDMLRATPQRSAAPPAMFDQIIESAWITASRVAATLQLKEPEQPTPQPAATELRPPRKKDKATRKAVVGSSTHAERPAAPATEPSASASSSSGKTIVRSAFGTPRLVDHAEQQATAAAASAAAASTATLHQQPSKETLQHHLVRLDAFIGFDLSAQQREASQAYRDLSPEGARFTVDQAVERLTQQADVQGVAKALQQGPEGSVMDRLKTYPLPTQAHIEALRKSGQLASVEMPRALKGEPGTLFEVKLQPSALRNGAMPRPMWLHIHTKEPVHVDKLATLGDAGFAATHVKSDTERGRNRQWQQARLREGHDNVLIYRGKVTPDLCRQLLGA